MHPCSSRGVYAEATPGQDGDQGESRGGQGIGKRRRKQRRTRNRKEEEKEEEEEQRMRRRRGGCKLNEFLNNK